MPRSLDELPACAGCGECCHMLVELDPAVDRVPEAMTIDRDGVWCMDQQGNGACVALDPATRQCTIYEQRPQVCRDFQRGAALCRETLTHGRWAASHVRTARQP